MVNIIHRVGIKAPISKVYEAVATAHGVAGWWTKEVEGSSSVGGSLVFRFLTLEGNEIGSMTMEVISLEPNKKVQWRCTIGPEEWIGTDIVFNLTQDADYTIVIFEHLNWREQIEFTAHCSMKWAIFMLSLKELAEMGQGKPSPNDIKIDNWN